jgi:hypothetical protein
MHGLCCVVAHGVQRHVHEHHQQQDEAQGNKQAVGGPGSRAAWACCVQQGGAMSLVLMLVLDSSMHGGCICVLWHLFSTWLCARAPCAACVCVANGHGFTTRRGGQ